MNEPESVAFPGSAAAQAPSRVPWGVSALLLATSDALAARFGAVAVRGELSGMVRAASGHCYFNLKDASGANGILRCAMFRRAASLLDFQPRDGQQVDVRGRLGVYEARGELQLAVESMQRVGAGSLYEEFLRLRARLEGLGLFDPARKRSIASFPHALGVVTSPGAAALRDVLSTLRRRAPHVRVVVYPSLVQGAEAPAALVAALELAGRRAEVDTLLLVRGGGALEDLWAFNDERVVHAVAACPLPVVCGVGHETDITLADLAADLRAPTPTAAAELAAPVRDEALALLQARQQGMQRAATRSLQQQAQRVDSLAQRLGRPGRALWGQADRLTSLQQRMQAALLRRRSLHALEPAQRAQRLDQALRQPLQRAALRLDAAQQRLQALDPARVLQRGYAWVEDDAGRAVVSVQQLQAGQVVRAVWADGRATAQVKDVEALPAAA